MQLYICGIPELKEFRHKDSVTHILSLIDEDYPDCIFEMPEMEPLFESFQPHTRLELKFDDVTVPSRFYVAPTHEDIECILEFGKTVTKDDTLLVHCHAGISRSTAAAALILLQAYPE